MFRKILVFTSMCLLASGGIKLARFQLAAWRKAHEDLGNGVRDPGKWLSPAYGAARII